MSINAFTRSESLTKKLVLGFAAMATAAVIGAAGIAGATTNKPDNGSNNTNVQAQAQSNVNYVNGGSGGHSYTTVNLENNAGDNSVIQNFINIFN